MTKITQEHPWVTEDGAKPLIPKDVNISYPIDPPTDAEVNAAITGNMKQLLVVVSWTTRRINLSRITMFTIHDK